MFCSRGTPLRSLSQSTLSLSLHRCFTTARMTRLCRNVRSQNGIFFHVFSESETSLGRAGRAQGDVRIRGGQERCYTKRVSIEKTSGNEVYYTASSLLFILKNSCSKLHFQTLFKLKLFSYKIKPINSKHLQTMKITTRMLITGSENQCPFLNSM